MNGIILIGKKTKYNGGPSGIVNGLEKEFMKSNINTISLRLSDNDNRLKYVVKLFKTIYLHPGYAVNVHSDGFMLSLLVLFCSKIFRRNRGYFLTVHGIHKTVNRIYGKHEIFHELMEKILLKKFPSLICVSEMLKKDIEQTYRRHNCIYVVPNATDIDCYLKSISVRKENKLIMLGGINEVKGIDVALELMRYLIVDKQMNIKLEIYGKIYSEDVKERYEQYLRENKLENYIYYKGELYDKAKIAKILNQSLLQLCLSKYDSFNVSVIEGMIVGCPAICSIGCGASYLIESWKNGLNVDLKFQFFNNAYKYIVKCQKNDLFYLEQLNNAANIQEEVSWRNVGNEYCKIMQIKRNNINR